MVALYDKMIELAYKGKDPSSLGVMRFLFGMFCFLFRLDFIDIGTLDQLQIPNPRMKL